MLRLLAWTAWVILFIPAIYLNVFKLPFRLTMTKGQMVISEVRTEGSNIPRNYVIGVVAGRNKPVHLSIHRLTEKTTKFSSEEAFIHTYVNTGVPLDVVVGTMWMASYDVAFPDKPSSYSIVELLVADAILLLTLLGMYAYLRRTTPPAPPETPYDNQPGGF